MRKWVVVFLGVWCVGLRAQDQLTTIRWFDAGGKLYQIENRAYDTDGQQVLRTERSLLDEPIAWRLTAEIAREFLSGLNTYTRSRFFTYRLSPDDSILIDERRTIYDLEYEGTRPTRLVDQTQIFTAGQPPRLDAQRTHYTYNPEGQLTARDVEIRTTAEEAWRPFRRLHFGYDEAGRLLADTTFRFDTDAASYLPDSYRSYDYPNDTTEITESFQFENGAWRSEIQIFRRKNGDEQLLTELFSQGDDTLQFTAFTYAASGEPATYYYRYILSPTSRGVVRLAYEYGAQDRLLGWLSTGVERDEAGLRFSDTTRTTFSYNSENLISSERRLAVGWTRNRAGDFLPERRDSLHESRVYDCRNRLSSSSFFRKIIRYRAEASPADTIAYRTVYTYLAGCVVRAEQKPSLQLIPNPANDFVFIQSELFTQAGATVQLMDLRGRTLWRGDGLRTNSHFLRLPPLLPGTYIVRVQRGAAVVQAKLVRL